MSITVKPPYGYYTDADGSDLEGGKIYIGVAGLDAEANPVSVYWDSALTVAAAQPIRTIGGVPDNSGTPADFFTAADYSVTVRTSADMLVYSKLQLNANDPDNLGLFKTYNTVALLLASTETTRGAGAIWEAGNFRYIEVASGGDITNSAGTAVELDLIPDAYGVYNLDAIGIVAGGDLAPTLQSALDQGWLLITWAENYALNSTVTMTGNGVRVFGSGSNSKVPTPSIAIGHNTDVIDTDTTVTAFGGFTLSGFSFTGGDATFASTQNRWIIKSHYPFTNLYDLNCEASSGTYLGNGIQLKVSPTLSSMSPWLSKMSGVRFIMNVGATAQRTLSDDTIALQVDIFGGAFSCKDCSFGKTRTGIDIVSGFGLTFDNVDLEDIFGGTTTETDPDSGCYRIGYGTGSNPRGIRISGSYIESYSRAMFVHQCDGLVFEGNFLNDVRGYFMDASALSGVFMFGEGAAGVNITGNNITNSFANQALYNSESDYEVRSSGNSIFFDITDNDYTLVSYIVGQNGQYNRGSSRIISTGDFFATVKTGVTTVASDASVTFSYSAATGQTRKARLVYNTHGLTTGDWVVVYGGGVVEKALQVTVIDVNTFDLYGTELLTAGAITGIYIYSITPDYYNEKSLKSYLTTDALTINPATTGTAYTLFPIEDGEIWEVYVNRYDGVLQDHKSLVRIITGGSTSNVVNIVAGTSIAVTVVSNEVKVTQSTGGSIRLECSWVRVRKITA